MKRHMKKIIAVLVMTLSLALSSCVYEMSETEKKTAVRQMADSAFSLYDDGRLSAGDNINADNAADYLDKNDKVYKLLDDEQSESHSFSVTILDADTVLIRTYVEFQSGGGYIVTRNGKELPEQVEVKGYDQDRVRTEKVSGEKDMYSFSGGY